MQVDLQEDRKQGKNFATSKTKVSPPPIKNISTDFPSTKVKLQDFFQVHEADTGQNATIYLSFTMPGTTEEALHDSMVNTLKQNNLWLISDELASKQKDEVGFVQNGNPTYTCPQGVADKITAAIIKLALTNSVASALVDKIKGKEFIFCKSNKLYRFTAIGEGIQMLTTNNNYGIVMRLIGMLPPNLISHYYQIRSKMIKRQMKPDLYDKLILRHQDEVNKQGQIVLTNIDADLFETQVNFV